MSRTQVHTDIRPVADGDHDAIAAFFAGLSAGTRYLRFFTSAAPSAAMVRVLCGDGQGADVVVAVNGPVVVGHAMAVASIRRDGIRVADVGVVVDDEWQGRGLGSALLAILVRRAQVRGAAMMVMDVLAENGRVLGLVGRRWPHARYYRAGESVTIYADVRDREDRRPDDFSRCLRARNACSGRRDPATRA